ncbi:MAG: filamentous hemagglutinin N-terminal domain-containing protein [Pseudomonadota bacterium]
MKLRYLPLLVAASFTAAVAAPTAPVVVSGQASFNQQGNVFSVTNSPNAIINWQSFSINAGEVTRFLQQSADSAVLNRIIGQDPSQILGALQSNGRVFLINPNGIMFGKDARIDVGALTASTLNLTNSDFLAGKKNFNGASAGKLSNAGTINGGQVFLIASSVENSGIITAPNGQVVLAAGHTVQLVDSGNPDVHVVLSAPADQALNLGQIISAGGKVGIYGALVNQRGVVNANSAVQGVDGKIVLKASGDAQLEAGSLTTATGAGKGGSISVQGQRVALTGDARIDASGVQGGGNVYVGGGYQGKDAAIVNAQVSHFGSDASIKADATGAGDGGKVVLWSDGTTRAYGRISAAGAGNGNGGLVETSGHALDVSGVRVRAAEAGTGRNGSWLLDPLDIDVNSATNGTVLADVNAFATNPSSSAQINAGLLSSATADVVLQATHDVQFSAPVNISSSATKLTVQAGNNINVNAAVTTNGGAITMTANDASSGAASGSGSVAVQGIITSANGAVSLSGKDVVVGASGGLLSGSGKIDLRSNAAGGTISVASGRAVTTASADVDLMADNVTLDGTISTGGAGGTGVVSLVPYTASRPMTIGANKPGGTLSLSPTEVSHISAFEFNLGSSAASGGLTVIDPLDLSCGCIRNLILESNGDLNINAAVALQTGVGSHLVFGTYGSHGFTNGAGATATADSLLVRADSMNVQASLVAPVVKLMPYSDSRNINIGNGASGSALNIDNTEVGFVNASLLIISSPASTGAMTVVGDTSFTANTLLAGGLLLGNGNGNIVINAPVSVHNNSSGFAPFYALTTQGAVSQGASGAISASAIAAVGTSVDLAAASNGASVVAGKASTGDFKFKSAGVLQVAAVDTFNGIEALGNINLQANGDVSQAGDAGGVLKGASLSLVGLTTPRGVSLSNAMNQSGAVSATNVDSVYLTTSGDLTVGVGGVGIATGVGASNPGITVNAPSGLLKVLQPINAGTGPVSLAAQSIQVGLPVIENAESTGTTTANISGSNVWLVANALGTGRVSVSNGAQVSGTTSINVVADQMDFETTAHLTAATGMVDLTTSDDFGRAFDLGLGAVDSASTLGLSQRDLQAIDASLLRIGHYSDGNAGLIRVVGAADLSAAPHASSTLIDASSAGVQINGPLRVKGTLLISSSGAVQVNSLAEAVGGVISIQGQGITGTGVVKGLAGVLDSTAGIGTDATALDTEVSSLDLSNNSPSSSLPIHVRNNFSSPAPLILTGAEQLGSGNAGGVTIDNYGAFTIGGPVSTDTGAISLKAHSPLTVLGSASITTNLGNIALEAGGSDDLVIASGATVAATSGGTITLSAGNNIVTTGATITQASGTPTLVPQKSPPITAPTAPSLATCVATPSSAGCDVVLQAALTSCTANPSGPDCASVPGTLAYCTANPSATGCAAVLPTLTQCMASPTTAGCLAVLPSTGTCSINPGTDGCAVVPGTLAYCTANPGASGCGAILPSLSACIAAPTTFGCSAILPTLSACTTTPSLAGCSAVLPPINVCVATPAAPGCSAVLPTLAACTTTPTLAGCSAVLPTVSICTSAPTTPGCSAVLPSITSCTTTPTLPGCSAVLPTLSQCQLTPSQAGCSAVLPSLSACAVAPSLPGCSVVLPSLSTCVATPSAAGCSAVLPSLSACVAAPSAPGCSVVLPSLATCSSTPSLPGCSVVLPTLASCTSNPALAGCSAVLPSLSTCTATPTAAGCSAVLPSLAQCVASPTLQGCAAVLPPVDVCVSNPSASGCVAVVPPTQSQEPDEPISQALNTTVNLVNTITTTTLQTVPLLTIAKSVTPTSGGSAAQGTTPPAADAKSDNKTADTKADESKKDDKKDTVAAAKDTGAKKDEPVKKLYCN